MNHPGNPSAAHAKSVRGVARALGLALLAALSGCASAPEDHTGIAADAVLNVDQFLYFRCNATGWGVDETTRVLSTSNSNVFQLVYDVSQPWMTTGHGAGDECTFTMTNQRDGWGTQQTSYQSGAGTIDPPGGSTLAPGGNYVTVLYPHLGRYEVTVNWQLGTYEIAEASGTCAPAPVQTIACTDFTDAPLGAWSYEAQDGAATTLSQTPGGVSGTLLSVDTQAAFGFDVRYTAPAPISAPANGVLQLAVRASNTNQSGWQINSPVVTIEDVNGARGTYTPASQLFPTDGVTWDVVEVPLAGGPGWTVSGAAVDFSHVHAVEVATDTWGAGFHLDLDAIEFEAPGAICQATCPNGCSGRGTCNSATLQCSCPIGALGADCGTCGDGFVDQGGTCVLAADGAYTTWPNPVSHTNGDAWLTVHHDDVTVMQPKLMVLHFVNSVDPTKTTTIDDVVAGFADGSRHHAYSDNTAQPQLQYQVVKTVDLRDGVDGRPPAPAGWAFQNSTLYPRKGAPGSLLFDYAALYSPTFAAYYGFPDPANPGGFLPLCSLIEQGLVNEVWVVGSGDVAGDAAAFEVVESKQRYDESGNKIPGSFEPCAGNGCFTPDVPVCARSNRIGWVNYNRGPGCYMHSQGHCLEGTATHHVIPAFSEWFLPFASLDLDTRYGMPFSSLYGIGCSSPPCVSYPTETGISITANGVTTARDPYDAVCGNVHFPPDGRQDYDYADTQTVLSSCESFGLNQIACGVDQTAPVQSSLWASYEALHGDCGGGFLTWWYQSMPAHQSGQQFADGRPMQPVWPFLFY